MPRSWSKAWSGASFGEAVQLIHELNQTRDRGLYQEVGKLTRELHSAIVVPDRPDHAAGRRGVADYRCHRTPVLCGQAHGRRGQPHHGPGRGSTPVLNDLASEAKALSTDWQRFMRREVAAEEFRDLVKRVDSFLTHSAEGNRKVAGHLNDILLAQDYQDPTGQVISAGDRSGKQPAQVGADGQSGRPLCGHSA